MRADGTGSHTYQWDAENRLASVDGVAGQACQTTWTACYTYNALGQRVEKKVGSAYTEILYDGYGYVTAFHDRTTWSQLFSPSVGGRQIMKYQTSLTLFLHGNTLGSTQTITDQAGVVVQDALYYPWGQRWTYVGTLWDERFASLGQRDSEATLDPTLFRTYSSGQGRWLSPDPIGGDISNPQSLNRYAYVLNNPASFTDPLGLDCSATVWNTDRGRWEINCRFTDVVTGAVQELSEFMSEAFFNAALDKLTNWLAPIPPPPPPVQFQSEQVVAPLNPCIDTSDAEHRKNQQMDIAARSGYGQLVRSPITGRVSGTKRDGTGPYPPNAPSRFAREANFVRIENNEYTFTLVHAASPVPQDTTVYLGLPIGIADRTGRQTGPHVHVNAFDSRATALDPAGLFSGCTATH